VRHDGGSRRRVAALAAVALAACARSHPAPHRGAAVQVVGESTKLRRGDRLPPASPFFDGQRVSLRAARGEILGVQVVREGGATVPVSLRIGGPGVDVIAFAVEHLPVVRPSTSMYATSRGRGEYPDRLRPAAQPIATDRAAFFDVAVAAGADAGERAGELVVGDQRWPVVLRIEPVELPSVAAAPRIWAYYDPREVARDEGATPGTDEAWRIEQAYATLFRAHGVYASPELRIEDADRRLPLAIGVAYVPVVFPPEPDDLREVIAFFERRLAGTGQRAFAIPVDEPRDTAARAEVRARAEAARAAGAGRHVLYAVTDTPQDVYGDLIDIYISPYAIERERTDSRAALWTYNGGPPLAGSMILDTEGVALRTWGWIAWRWRVPVWYIWDGLYWHDRYSARRKKVERSAIPQSPFDRDPVTFDDGDDHGNLDGVLAFPGVLPSLRLKALRRGQQDRLLLELVARCNAPMVESLAAAMVPRALADGGGKPPAPGSWPLEEAAWETARQRLLDAAAPCALGRP